MKGQMKAIVYEGPKRAVLEERPIPTPEKGEVLIRVDYCGICGSDMGIRRGTHPRAKAPLILGHEFLGKVAEDGKKFRKGDRVVCYPLISCGHCLACRTGNAHVCNTLKLDGIDRDGGMAEWICMDENKLFKVPDGVSDLAAVLSEPLAVIVHSMFQAGLKPLDTVVINGAGAIGCLTGIVAKHLGASKVWISDIAAKKLSRAAQLGLTTVDAAKENLQEIVLKGTDGEGCDVLFECSGSEAAVMDATRITRVGGHICITATHGQPHTVRLIDLNFKEQVMMGTRVYRKEQFGRAVELTRELEPLLKMVVSHVIPLKDAADENEFGKVSGFAMIEDPDSDTCKVVVDCRPACED